MTTYKHGFAPKGRPHRLYRIWIGMKKRCYNPNSKKYKSYGQRGIKIAKEWRTDFLQFYNWSMSNGYKHNLTINRINNNGNYEPKNCNWVSAKEQQKNTQQSVYINYQNKSFCMKELADYLKLDYYSFRYFYQRYGLDIAIKRARKL